MKSSQALVWGLSNALRSRQIHKESTNSKVSISTYCSTHTQGHHIYIGWHLKLRLMPICSIHNELQFPEVALQWENVNNCEQSLGLVFKQNKIGSFIFHHCSVFLGKILLYLKKNVISFCISYQLPLYKPV